MLMYGLRREKWVKAQTCRLRYVFCSVNGPTPATDPECVFFSVFLLEAWLMNLPGPALKWQRFVPDRQMRF